jgi:hypothetical protein
VWLHYEGCRTLALATQNGRTYYYVYKRRNRKVKRVYRGSGAFAVWVQTKDDWKRRELEDERRHRAETDEEHRQALLVEQARGRAVTTLVRIGLEATGFIRYSRNPWKSRIMKSLSAPIHLSEVQ